MSLLKPLLISLFLFSSVALYAQETEQYELTNLEFRGNNSIPSVTLSEIIASKQTPYWFLKFLNRISASIGRETSYFDSLRISEDLGALESYYKDNGFFKAKFQSEYKIRKENNEAELIFHIEEGPHFKIRSLELKGLGKLPREISGKLSNNSIDSTKYFSKTLINETIKTLVGNLRDNGYMLGDVDHPEVYVYPDSNFVDVKINFITGKRYIVDSLMVDKKGPGKDFVDDGLIKKIMGIRPGDYYSAEEKQRSQIRLYRTNLFSSVLVSAINTDSLSNRIPFIITADIGSLHEFSPEVILNNQESAFNLGLGANYVKKNFLGEARTLTLGANFAIQDIFNKYVFSNLPKFLNVDDNTVLGYLDTRLSVEQPYLFDARITSRLELYWTENKKNEYKSFTLGSKLSFDFELPRHVYINSLTAYYSIEGADYSFKRSFVSEKLKVEEDSIKLSLEKKWETTSIIGAEIGANETNSMLFPTQGYNLSLMIEEANLIPAVFHYLGISDKPKSQFYKIQTSISYFPDVYKSQKSAFGIKFKAGYLQAYIGEGNDIPLNRKFTAGGSNSVRGWRARELAPASRQDISQVNSALQSNIDIYDVIVKDFPLGGNFLIEGSFETRNRLMGDLGMAAFIDYGNTWKGYQEFSFKDLAVAVGFGFRYYSSFAPIRIDLGFKAYDPSEKKNFFKLYENTHILQNLLDVITLHLGIGEAF